MRPPSIQQLKRHIQELGPKTSTSTIKETYESEYLTGHNDELEAITYKYKENMGLNMARAYRRPSRASARVPTGEAAVGGSVKRWLRWLWIKLDGLWLLM